MILNLMNPSNSYLIKSYLEQSNEVPRTAVDRVYDDLLRRIVELELPPGSPLVRGELCQEYQVSQTPVREALLRLEQVGLVNVKPQSGTEVSYIDIQQLEQNHFLREALEFEVVRRLAAAPDAELVARLRTLVDMQSQVATGAQEDMVLFVKLDEQFHRAMFDALGQKSLHKLVRSRSGHMDRVRRLHLPSEGKIRSVLDGHRRIINAIEGGSPDHAYTVMREHLMGTISRVHSLSTEFPEYFC